MILTRSEDLAKARDFLERGLRIKERVYGKDHREVAFVLQDLGYTFRKLGNFEKGQEVLERALAILERVCG